MGKPIDIRSALLPLFLGGCGSSPPPEVAPAPPPDTVVVRTVDTVRLEAPRDTTSERLATRLQIQLLERDAELADIRLKLDEARREVVRTMARPQTVATRAEAASAMAEADLAYQALRGTAASGATAAQVKRLLDQSGEEFTRSNFAGAIYLATQGKTLARQGSTGLGRAAGAGAQAGETAFAAPLTLTATSRANVRQGPGTRFSVLRTLDRGATVRGVSYLGDWIRVADSTGTGGWVLNSLLAGGAGVSR